MGTVRGGLTVAFVAVLGAILLDYPPHGGRATVGEAAAEAEQAGPDFRVPSRSVLSRSGVEESAARLPASRASRNGRADYTGLPLYFEPNRGQGPAGYTALTRAGRFAVALGREHFTLTGGAPGCRTRVTVRLAGANPGTAPVLEDRLPGVNNYYPGNDPSQWIERVPQYRRAVYDSLYPGVRLQLHGARAQLEYDWIVEPGGDPGPIRVAFDGISSLALEVSGRLRLETACGTLYQDEPLAYQETREGRRSVGVRYVLSGANSVALRLGSYDRSRTLVVDPVLSYAILIGSSGIPGDWQHGRDPQPDAGMGVTVDAAGNAYLVGTTYAADFPATDGSFAGQRTAFVAKINAAGTAVLYASEFGNSEGNAVAVDAAGYAYVTGPAYAGFPVTAGGSPTGPVFLAKLSPSGTPVYATRLFGGVGAAVYAIALDSAGNIFVGGSTASPSFPVTLGAFQATYNGAGADGYVAKFSPAGALLAATFVGGTSGYYNDYDLVKALTVAPDGSVYAVGDLRTRGFPATPGTYQSSCYITDANGPVLYTPCPTGGVIAKLSNSLSTLLLGIIFRPFPNSIALDPTGAVYVAGSAGSYGGFAAKLNAAGTALVYYKEFAMSHDRYSDAGSPPGGIAVDASGNAFVVGSTGNTTFPTVSPWQLEKDSGFCNSLRPPCGDAYIMMLDPNGELRFSTFFGGPWHDAARGVAVDGAGNAYVAGSWGSGLAAFPSLGLQPLSKFNGAFVLKVKPDGMQPLFSAAGITNAASFKPEGLSAGIYSLFGDYMDVPPGIFPAGTVPLPTQIEGVSVLLNGVPAPLYAVANVNGHQQINFQVPEYLMGYPAVTVVAGANRSLPVSMQALICSEAAPGIFTMDGASGAIQHASDYQLVTQSNPARPGEVIVIYATGLGEVKPDPGRGNPATASPLSMTVYTPSVTIGGQQAQVLFSGLTPGLVGLNQVNVLVPAGVPPGNADVIVSLSAAMCGTATPSNTVKLPIATPPPALSRELQLETPGGNAGTAGTRERDKATE